MPPLKKFYPTKPATLLSLPSFARTHDSCDALRSDPATTSCNVTITPPSSSPHAWAWDIRMHGFGCHLPRQARSNKEKLSIPSVCQTDHQRFILCIPCRHLPITMHGGIPSVCEIVSNLLYLSQNTTRLISREVIFSKFK